MSEATIEFCATVESVQGGDDEVRIVLSVKDTPADLAAAVGMLGKLNKVLLVSAYLGADNLAQFRGAIPAMKTGVQFRANKPPVIKLDIPASDAIKALRLIGYSERLIRFEVADEGERVGKNGKDSQKPKAPKEPTPHGALWQELLHRNMGFEHVPGVKEALEALRVKPTETPHELMRAVFGVKSLSREVGPDEIVAYFPFPAVRTMVEQAKRKAGEKK